MVDLWYCWTTSTWDKRKFALFQVGTTVGTAYRRRGDMAIDEDQQASSSIVRMYFGWSFFKKVLYWSVVTCCGFLTQKCGTASRIARVRFLHARCLHYHGELFPTHTNHTCTRMETSTKSEARKSNVLLPIWPVVRVWELIVAISAVISSTAIAFQAAYDGSSPWIISIIYLCDFVYILGIVIRLFTGFERKGVVVTTRKKIFLHNLKTTLIADLFSVIPFELAAFAAGEYSEYAAALLRLNRVLRCRRFWYLCSKFIVH